MTGSVSISRALTRGLGLGFVIVGLLLMAASAVTHGNPFHLAAALLFAGCIAGLRALALIDESLLPTPWRNLVHYTDRLSLWIVIVATFGPVLILAVHGESGWTALAFAGILLLWWSVLDELVADYRRILKTLGVFVLVWAPITLLRLPDYIEAELTFALALVALMWSSRSLRAALRGLPSQYRKVQEMPKVEPEE